MKYRIGDSVVVTTGRDKGKTGSVTRILAEDNRVVIDGVNERTKHVKAQQGRAGDRIKFFAPIDISNIAVLDIKTKKASKIGYLMGKDGTKTRISKKSGEAIADPRTAKKPKKAATKTIKA